MLVFLLPYCWHFKSSRKQIHCPDQYDCLNWWIFTIAVHGLNQILAFIPSEPLWGRDGGGGWGGFDGWWGWSVGGDWRDHPWLIRLFFHSIQYRYNIWFFSSIRYDIDTIFWPQKCPFFKGYIAWQPFFREFFWRPFFLGIFWWIVLN